MGRNKLMLKRVISGVLGAGHMGTGLYMLMAGPIL
jgi:hypothetical protein